jgi:hypothetical protein
MQAKVKNSELNACYIGQAGMHQGRLAFNKTLLLLKLLHVLIFKSFKRVTLYVPQHSHPAPTMRRDQVVTATTRDLMKAGAAREWKGAVTA